MPDHGTGVGTALDLNGLPVVTEPRLIELVQSDSRTIVGDCAMSVVEITTLVPEAFGPMPLPLCRSCSNCDREQASECKGDDGQKGQDARSDLELSLCVSHMFPFRRLAFIHTVHRKAYRVNNKLSDIKQSFLSS